MPTASLHLHCIQQLPMYSTRVRHRSVVLRAAQTRSVGATHSFYSSGWCVRRSSDRPGIGGYCAGAPVMACHGSLPSGPHWQYQDASPGGRRKPMPFTGAFVTELWSGAAPPTMYVTKRLQLLHLYTLCCVETVGPGQSEMLLSSGVSGHAL